MEIIESIFDDLAEERRNKTSEYKDKVFDSQQFQEQLKFLSGITNDFVQTIKAISFYSTRANDIYDNFLTIRASDDLIQSAIGIQSLVLNGIQNTSKRELRYLIEMSVKYLVVDQELMGKSLDEKTKYLKSDVPNSSIDVISRLALPFERGFEKEFKDEVTDFFYKQSAYIHPSQRQIEEQLDNYSKGYTIGFESAKSLSNMNILVFRAYDMILTMLFVGFGQSMSGDLFIEYYDSDTGWKYHKGKYVKAYSKLFDYKHERNS